MDSKERFTDEFRKYIQQALSEMKGRKQGNAFWNTVLKRAEQLYEQAHKKKS